MPQKKRREDGKTEGPSERPPTRDTAVSEGRRGAILRVQVTPRCSREELSQHQPELIRVKLTAPPVEGEANQALVKLLARVLGVSRADVDIISGSRSRQKTVQIRGLSVAEAKNRLDRAASS